MALSGVVHESAMAAPDADLVVDLARTWTYSEAADQIGRVQAAICQVGVKAGDRVGVHFNKGAAGFLAMHAVVSAGAVAVPLDPASPASRLARICREMQISVLTADAPRRTTVEAIHDMEPLRAVIGLDCELDGAWVLGPHDVALLDPLAPATVSQDSLAYILTTSGSTGEPKGISHTHASGRAYGDLAVRAFGVNSEDRVADISPHHFDISTFSLWATPLGRACNIVVNEAYQLLPASHSQLLADEAATIWYSVPFLIQQLVLRGDLQNRNLDALRQVHFGGEVVSASIIAEMMKHCPNARFVNVFGPAEVNTCTAAYFDTPPPSGEPLSIGFPVDNATLRVVDPDSDAPVDGAISAAGEIGELWVATPHLMAGYWNRDETNARVIRNVDGLAYYRTGDLVSRDGSGELAFHGRADNQIKVRGFRIELEGVEADLESLVLAAETAESVVVSAVRHDSGQDQIVAGVLGATADFSRSAFVKAAASVLRAYAIPTQVVHLPAASFTGSGKLNRRILREQAVSLVKETT